MSGHPQRGTLEETLAGYGFAIEGMGGNTSAYTRMNGTAEEIVTLGDEAEAPEAWADGPLLVTIKGYGPPREYVFSDGFELADYLSDHDGNTPTTDGNEHSAECDAHLIAHGHRECVGTCYLFVEMLNDLRTKR